MRPLAAAVVAAQQHRAARPLVAAVVVAVVPVEAAQQRGLGTDMLAPAAVGAVVAVCNVGVSCSSMRGCACGCVASCDNCAKVGGGAVSREET